MATVGSMAELEKYINQKISNSLKTDVAATAVKTMQKRIEKDVYNAYTPYSTDGVTPHYERTGQLLKDVQVEIENDNTIVVENIRNERGRDIVKIIEEGKGYDWGYKRDLNKEIGKREFVKHTYEELASGSAKQALAEGLRKQGLSVE
jgi:hypothetical protein